MDEQTPQTGPLSEPASVATRVKERPTVVTAVAAYQWLKAVLFAQLFWNLWSAPPQSLAGVSRNILGLTQRDIAEILLLAIASYLVILGLGLWNLQKWTLFLILPIWFLDFTYDFDPGFFGLEHVADLLPSDKFYPVLIAITAGDVIAFLLFANREILKAFDVEDIAKIFWPND